ncbi:MAG: thioredoxin domain-containing protein, partial [Candidatus Zixiibacteriota bacterium]
MQKSTIQLQEYKYTNHLIDESSPYLLQHAHNPVDWYPWSDEAINKALKENKPIFLSIGYSACHWCHVMEEESFKNDEIAAILNNHFISIKVDREQRPDLDQIYMSATMAINGSGGWPMSVFLTPDLKPFFAGTYFPPNDSYGRPGFKKVITQISEAFKEDRVNIDNYAEALQGSLKNAYSPQSVTGEIDMEIVNLATNQLMASYDSQNGGFGGAPKFPHASDLSFLLGIYAQNKDSNILKAVSYTLDAMANGGIYDQIGGGFHRYATDEKWLIPHFEKMLYDNGTLALTYGQAYQLTKNEKYKLIVEETLDFILREMQDKSGG